MEIILGCLIIIGVIVFLQLLRPKNFDQPVKNWSDDELARRLMNYERIWSIAVTQAVSGNIDSMTKHIEAGNKAKEIRDEIARRQSLQTLKDDQRSSVTTSGEPIDVVTIAKAHAGDTNSQFLIEATCRSGTNGLLKGTEKAVKVPSKVSNQNTPRKLPVSGTGSIPSAALAAVIGAEPVARAEVIKKLWDYIKANNLQDATNKRVINADDKLLAVFGKPQVTMFELAGIVGKHLG